MQTPNVLKSLRPGGGCCGVFYERKSRGGQVTSLNISALTSVDRTGLV